MLRGDVLAIDAEDITSDIQRKEFEIQNSSMIWNNTRQHLVGWTWRAMRIRWKRPGQHIDPGRN